MCHYVTMCQLVTPFVWWIQSAINRRDLQSMSSVPVMVLPWFYRGSTVKSEGVLESSIKLGQWLCQVAALIQFTSRFTESSWCPCACVVGQWEWGVARQMDSFHEIVSSEIQTMYFAPFWTAIWSKGHEPCFFVYTVHHCTSLVWNGLDHNSCSKAQARFNGFFVHLVMSQRHGMSKGFKSSAVTGCLPMFAALQTGSTKWQIVFLWFASIIELTKKTNRWSTEKGWKAKLLHNVSIQIFKIPCYVLLDDLMKSINQAASEAARNAHKVQAENRIPDQI